MTIEKIFHDQSPRKNTANQVSVEPATPDHQSDAHPTEPPRPAETVTHEWEIERNFFHFNPFSSQITTYTKSRSKWDGYKCAVSSESKVYHSTFDFLTDIPIATVDEQTLNNFPYKKKTNKKTNKKQLHFTNSTLC